MKIFAYLYRDPLLDLSIDILIKNLTVDRVYYDIGKRYQLELLLKNCQKDTPDYLWIRALEDLGNSLEEITEIWNKFNSLKIKIITTQSTDIVSEINRNKIVYLDLKLPKILDQIEKNKASLRLQKGHALNRIKTLPPPGKAPYGYRRGKERYIIDRSTAPVVKDFFEQFLLFGSLRGAVNYLEKRYGKKIAVSTGSRWLTNPVYRGDLIYKNNEIISNTHTPIISREEAAQIDRLLRRNRKLPPRTASASRSLTGLVVCQTCEQSMTITQVTQRNKKKKYLYLSTKNCPLQPKCKSLPYEAVLQKTIDYICREFPKRVKNFKVNDLPITRQKIQETIDQKRAIIEQLRELVKT
ncbi:MAG: recombinase family protein, partial [Cyanobacteria bacterium P01_G01_bin.49]